MKNLIVIMWIVQRFLWKDILGLLKIKKFKKKVLEVLKKKLVIVSIINYILKCFKIPEKLKLEKYLVHIYCLIMGEMDFLMVYLIALK